jgi:transcription initiation factor TFIIB
VILERVIDVSSEWRTFANNDNQSEDRSRVGPIENKNTEIVYEKQAGSIFLDYIDRLHLDASVNRCGHEIFKNLVDLGLTKTRNTKLIVAVCIYIAAKQRDSPRTFKEIETVCELSAVCIQKYFSTVIVALKKAGKLNISLTNTSNCSNQHVARFWSKLLLKIPVEKLANKILNKSSDMIEICCKKPQSIAAASIYMACILIGIEFNPNQISCVSGVAVSTIKNTHKILNAKLNKSDLLASS